MARKLSKVAFGRCPNVCLLYCIAGFTTFFGGFAVYVFFRNHDMILFRFMPKPAFLNTFFIPVKNDSIASSVWLYNLPDGLWLLSGLLFLRAVWHEKPKTFLVYRWCFLCIAFLLEITQLFDGIAGTFDIFDIVTMGSIALLESIVHKVQLRRRQS